MPRPPGPGSTAQSLRNVKIAAARARLVIDRQLGEQTPEAVRRLAEMSDDGVPERPPAKPRRARRAD